MVPRHQQYVTLFERRSSGPPHGIVLDQEKHSGDSEAYDFNPAPGTINYKPERQKNGGRE
jgi:hypothetical protein